MIIVNKAKELLEKGYSVIPVDALKQPMINAWARYQYEPMGLDNPDFNRFKGASGLALLMGGKYSLVCIDFDTKYYLDSGLYERIKLSVDKSLLAKMSVRQTTSGGFHWVFSCPERTNGNQKLAMRETTCYEKDETYRELFRDPATRDKAMKIASQDKSRVLIETREHGGYIVIPPSNGYSMVFGPEEGFNTLTGQEYDDLMAIMRSFNEYTEIYRDRKIIKYKDNDVNPFELYDQNGDVISLLEGYGWENVGETTKNVRFKRPGAKSGSSALFDKNTRVLTVFSTSTVFDTNKGYPPATVFTLLEADGDDRVAYQKLIDLGYDKQ